MHIYLYTGGAYEKDKTIVKLVDDWRNWKPGDPPRRIRNRDVHRGYQGKGLGVAKKNYRTRQRMTPTHTSLKRRGKRPSKNVIHSGTSVRRGVSFSFYDSTQVRQYYSIIVGAGDTHL